jgi:competence protein ComFC
MYKEYLKPFWKDISKLVLDTLFPITCFSCNAEGEYLCQACVPKLTPIHQICIVCKKPSLAGLTHPKCQTLYAPDQSISFFDYKEELVSKLIIRGKYYFIPGIFRLTGGLIAQKMQADFSALINSESVTLSPVPLNKWRQHWRGFNQAEILSQSLAENLKLETMHLLKRSKFTKTQKDLKKEERQKNTANAFSLLPGVEIKNRWIILIDDVTTTGSTLLEATKVLKRNGAGKVTCLTIARE